MKTVSNWTLIESAVDWMAFGLDKPYLNQMTPVEYPFAVALIHIPNRPGFAAEIVMADIKISTMKEMIALLENPMVEVADPEVNFKVVNPGRSS